METGATPVLQWGGVYYFYRLKTDAKEIRLRA
jgi:hypothetical protein